uniref:Uncharacterized protein n=1 Tax=Anguilla anguilla TaxID=7936 RepID=A0A0E9X381_ANGAN
MRLCFLHEISVFALSTHTMTANSNEVIIWCERGGGKTHLGFDSSQNNIYILHSLPLRVINTSSFSYTILKDSQ